MLFESELVMEESMTVLHEFDEAEIDYFPTKDCKKLNQKPKSTVREGWEQSFKQMHANGDDQLLNPDVLEDDPFESW